MQGIVKSHMAQTVKASNVTMAMVPQPWLRCLLQAHLANPAVFNPTEISLWTKGVGFSTSDCIFPENGSIYCLKI